MCREYGGAARGLQLQLLELGYRFVFILPDLMMGNVFALKAYVRHLLSLESDVAEDPHAFEQIDDEVLHITLSSQESEITLRNYVVAMLDTSIGTSMSKVVSALGVWSSSLSVLRQCEQIAAVNASDIYYVPVFSDTGRNRLLVEKHFTHIVTETSSVHLDIALAPSDDFYLFDVFIYGGHDAHSVEMIEEIRQKLAQQTGNVATGPMGTTTLSRGLVVLVAELPYRVVYTTAPLHDDDLDYFVLRSRIVVHLNQASAVGLNLLRLNYLLSLGKCVVAERDSREALLELEYAYCDSSQGTSGAVVFAADANQLVGSVSKLLADKNSRLSIEVAAYQFYHQVILSKSSILDIALKASIRKFRR
jgi:hypothetical protein